MKCIKCGKEYSYSVMPFHRSRCNVVEIAPKEETEKESEKDINNNEKIEIKSKEYTLDQLLQMCLDNDNINYAPSTIKRWKTERCLKELKL